MSIVGNATISINNNNIDSILDKRLGRGISHANEDNLDLVTRARGEFAMDLYANGMSSPFTDTPDYTFTLSLPDLFIHEDKHFQLVVDNFFKNIIETFSLQKIFRKRLN